MAVQTFDLASVRATVITDFASSSCPVLHQTRLKYKDQVQSFDSKENTALYGEDTGVYTDFKFIVQLIKMVLLCEQYTISTIILSILDLCLSCWTASIAWMVLLGQWDKPG